MASYKVQLPHGRASDIIYPVGDESQCGELICYSQLQCMTEKSDHFNVDDMWWRKLNNSSSDRKGDVEHATDPDGRNVKMLLVEMYMDQMVHSYSQAQLVIVNIGHYRSTYSYHSSNGEISVLSPSATATTPSASSVLNLAVVAAAAGGRTLQTAGISRGVHGVHHSNDTTNVRLIPSMAAPALPSRGLNNYNTNSINRTITASTLDSDHNVGSQGSHNRSVFHGGPGRILSSSPSPSPSTVADLLDINWNNWDAASVALGDLFMTDTYLQTDLDMDEITAVAGLVTKEDLDVQRLVDVLFSQDVDLGVSREWLEYSICPPASSTDTSVKDVTDLTSTDALSSSFDMGKYDPSTGKSSNHGQKEDEFPNAFLLPTTVRMPRNRSISFIDNETGELIGRSGSLGCGSRNDSYDPSVPHVPYVLGNNSNHGMVALEDGGIRALLPDVNNNATTTTMETEIIDSQLEERQLASLIEALNSLNSSTLQAVVEESAMSTMDDGTNTAATTTALSLEEQTWDDVQSVLLSQQPSSLPQQNIPGMLNAYTMAYPSTLLDISTNNNTFNVSTFLTFPESSTMIAPPPHPISNGYVGNNNPTSHIISEASGMMNQAAQHRHQHQSDAVVVNDFNLFSMFMDPPMNWSVHPAAPSSLSSSSSPVFINETIQSLYPYGGSTVVSLNHPNINTTHSQQQALLSSAAGHGRMVQNENYPQPVQSSADNNPLLYDNGDASNMANFPASITAGVSRLSGSARLGGVLQNLNNNNNNNGQKSNQGNNKMSMISPSAAAFPPLHHEGPFDMTAFPCPHNSNISNPANGNRHHNDSSEDNILTASNMNLTADDNSFMMPSHSYDIQQSNDMVTATSDLSTASHTLTLTTLLGDLTEFYATSGGEYFPAVNNSGNIQLAPASNSVLTNTTSGSVLSSTNNGSSHGSWKLNDSDHNNNRQSSSSYVMTNLDANEEEESDMMNSENSGHMGMNGANASEILFMLDEARMHLMQQQLQTNDGASDNSYSFSTMSNPSGASSCNGSVSSNSDADHILPMTVTQIKLESMDENEIDDDDDDPMHFSMVSEHDGVVDPWTERARLAAANNHTYSRSITKSNKKDGRGNEDSHDANIAVNGMATTRPSRRSASTSSSTSASAWNSYTPGDNDAVGGSEAAHQHRHHHHRGSSGSTNSNSISRLSRDERAARELQLPVTAEEIVNMPVEEFNNYMTGQLALPRTLSRTFHQSDSLSTTITTTTTSSSSLVATTSHAIALTSDQVQLMKDIRRRGKNKVAAQNCRRRKLDNMSHLEREIYYLREELSAAKARRDNVIRERERYRWALRGPIIQRQNSASSTPPSSGRNRTLNHTSGSVNSVIMTSGLVLDSGGLMGNGDGRAEDIDNIRSSSSTASTSSSSGGLMHHRGVATSSASSSSPSRPAAAAVETVSHPSSLTASVSSSSSVIVGDRSTHVPSHTANTNNNSMHSMMLSLPLRKRKRPSHTDEDMLHHHHGLD